MTEEKFQLGQQLREEFMKIESALIASKEAVKCTNVESITLDIRVKALRKLIVEYDQAHEVLTNALDDIEQYFINRVNQLKDEFSRL